MHKFGIGLLLAALVVLCAPDGAQTNVRIRGTIVMADGDMLMLKSRDGQDLHLQIAPNATVAVAKPIKFEDIKQGDYVGATTKNGAGGEMVALEVHYLPPTVPPGQSPWDLQPGTTMTNANVAAIVQQTGKRELTLKYKDGQQTILVPEGTPLVRAVPGERADLKAGEYVFVAAQSGADGALTALRIQVSKDGVKPPQ